MSLENIDSGLLSYYKLDSGDVTADSFGDEDLININGVTTTTGKIGEAGVFINASERSLQASGANVFSFDGTEDFTITCWVEVDDLDPPGSDQIVLGKYNDPGATNQRQYLIFFDASTDQWRAIISEDGATNSADVSPTNNVTANVFDWLCLEYEASTRTLTLTRNNGTGGDTASDVAANASIHQSTKVFEIGNAETTTSDAWLDGRVDEVTIHQRLLTAAEKAAMYNGGNGVDLSLFLFKPTVSGSFGGFMKGLQVVSTSGFFGGLLKGAAETPTAGFGGFLFSQATSEAMHSGFFGGFMSAETLVSNSGFFGGFTKSFTTVPPTSFGGLLFSKATNDARNVDFFGGFMQGVGFAEASGAFGGFMQAQPQTPVPPAFFGGLASGLQRQTANFGGWIFGAPGQDDFAEQHSRTLVKVRSEDVVDQALNLDSQMILFQRANADFRAKLGIESTSNSQFHGKLEVTRDKIIPETFATVTKTTDPSGVIEVVVEASGLAGESNSFFTSAQIDFGEPYDVEFGVEGQILRGGIALPTVSGSISGFEFDQLNPGTTIGTSGFSKVIRASHIYRDPGRYIITTKFIDNLGIVHMQGFECDLLTTGAIASVSGVPVKGIDYPAIEISGIPREGSVPGSLRVDYQMRASGTGFTVLENEVAKLNNTTTATNDFINWNFGNGFTSTIKRPFSYYDAPGLYIPVLRYQFNHPSGIQTGTDASGVPVYGTRSIWLSESLLIGFNV